MVETTDGTLIAILANPPLTEGKRTLRRVVLAAELLGFAELEVANLFALPSRATCGIALLGVDENGWLKAREAIGPRLDTARGVLLAYGATAPTGPARLHFHRQVDWLRARITAQRLASWQVGDGPRHPSRWQRWTHREHPGVPFVEALRESLVPVSDDLGGSGTRFVQPRRDGGRVRGVQA